MTEQLDQNLFPKKEKPNVHFGLLVVFVAILFVGIVIDNFSDKFFYSIAIILSSISLGFAWSIMMLKRCRFNLIVLVTLILCSISYYTIIQMLYVDIRSIIIYSQYRTTFEELLHLVFTLGVFFPALIIFNKIKLKNYKPFIEKKDEFS